MHDMTEQPYRHRRSIRLKGYDYALPGAYFITFCTYRRLPLFGDVVDGAMRLNAHGNIAQNCWNALSDHFAHVKLDAFVVMPNHVHAVLWIRDVGARHVVPREQFSRPVPGSLAQIVRIYKAAVTRQSGSPVWQRNYYDHIIRDDAELDRIRIYIQENPANWRDDEDNPANRQRKHM